ncbi:MAG TPA: hypothetical protein ENI86_04905 [Acidimicrobiales bacterium]|nr:hypothetical protein [Acidimicrobiales bacterium]
MSEPGLAVPPFFLLTAVLVIRWWSGLRRARMREARIAAEIPSLMELVLVGARSGLGLGAALDLAATHSRSDAGGDLRAAMGVRRRGIPLSECLSDLRPVWGPHGQLAIGVLLASHHYGEPLVPAMERLVSDLRARSAARAEAEARKLPTRLLLPLVFLVLPAFALLTVVPVLVEALGGS